MLGSIIGDIVGSVYEFNNIKTKDFPFFSSGCTFTDDSILTLATADWLLHGGDVAHYYSKYAQEYPSPMGSYGGGFLCWIEQTKAGIFSPYNSCGNGSAMRVGPVGWAFDTEEEVMQAAKTSAECTHNHPEGIKGAQATALCILMARQGKDKETIRKVIEEKFHYDLQFTCDSIRDTYGWGAVCQNTVPQAIVAFLDAEDFEDAIRNVISIGGDSDTLGCITGSTAEAFYGIPQDLRDETFALLPNNFAKLVSDFENKYRDSTLHKNNIPC